LDVLSTAGPTVSQFLAMMKVYGSDSR